MNQLKTKIQWVKTQSNLMCSLVPKQLYKGSQCMILWVTVHEMHLKIHEGHIKTVHIAVNFTVPNLQIKLYHSQVWHTPLIPTLNKPEAG